MHKLTLERLQVAYYVRRCHAVDALVQQISVPTRKPCLLLIRPDAIGDYLLFRNMLPAYQRYAQKKGLELHLLGNVLWKPLAEAWDSQYVDKFIFLDRKKLYFNTKYRYNLLKKLRKEGYSEAIAPVYSRLMLYDDALLRATGAIEKIGLEGNAENTIPKEKIITDTYYTKRFPNGEKYLFEFLRNRHFAEQLTGENLSNLRPHLPQPERTLEGLPTRYLLAFPGAADAHKRWPFFGKLIEKCLKKWPDYEVVLSGSPSEFDLAEQIIQNLPFPLNKRVHNHCGHYALPEVPALVAQAEALLCNDSMSTHLGAMLGVPTFCIATGQHYGRFLPYPEGFAPNLHCFFPPEVEETPHVERYEKFQPAFGRPIEGVSVERVFEALLQTLKNQ